MQSEGMRHESAGTKTAHSTVRTGHRRESGVHARAREREEKTESDQDGQYLMTNQFITNLEKLVPCHIRRLEGLFGRRDNRFVFAGVVVAPKNDDTPRLYYPKNYSAGLVNIQISRYPYERCLYSQAAWQVAHECVHLIDPAEGNTTILEEGLATWYQNEESFHEPIVRRYIKSNNQHRENYAEAERLVCDTVPQLLQAVKAIRQRQIRIGEINTDILAPYLPNVACDTVERLCQKFPV